MRELALSSASATAFLVFGERQGVRQAATAAILDEVAECAGRWAGRVGEIGFDARTTRHLERVMLERARELAS